MSSLGTMMRTRTPRSSAARSAARVSSSGTKYEADRSMLRSAAVIDSRYISSMLSPPPLGELVNTCACIADGRERGKILLPLQQRAGRLDPVVRNAACIWATAGPSRR
jgi:hypothetical protein